MTVLLALAALAMAVLYAARQGRRDVATVLAWWRRRRAAAPGWRAVGWDEECPLCDDFRGAPVAERDAHVFAETHDETWAGAGAASGTSVVYCREHCPGGCSRGCPL